MYYADGSDYDYKRNDDEDCVQNAGLTHADLRLPKKRVLFHTHITPAQTNDVEDEDKNLLSQYRTQVYRAFWNQLQGG